MNATAIPADVRDRIIAAANALYEQAERESFPTVDAVRRAARVDMNAASAVMREWRRQQTVQATPVVVAIPEAVQQAQSQALAALWTQAQELANESLRAAQASWETERAELDAMRQEMAAAYEAQASELEAAQERATQMQHAVEAAADAHREQLESLRAELAAAVTRAERAEVRSGEIEKRVAALESERDAARLQAGEAREVAAKLSGQLEAVQSQNTALLATLKPAAK